MFYTPITSLIYVLILSYFLPLQLLLASSYNGDPTSNLGKENLRGNCQRELSGLYLALLDQKNVTEKEKVLLIEQKSVLSAKIEKLVAKTEAPESTKNDYDAAQDMKNVEKLNLKTNLQQQISGIELLLAQKIETEKSARKKLSLFEESLKPALMINEKRQKSYSPAYKFTIEFQHRCPKYNDSCPLTADEIKAFEILHNRGFLTPICHKFLVQSKDAGGD